MLQSIRLAFDGLAQIVNTSFIFAIGLNEFADGGIFLLQRAAVQIERMLFDFVHHYNDRRVGADTVDQVYAAIRVSVLAAFPDIKHQVIKAALCEEELVRRVHNLLPVEIPDVQPYVLITIELDRPMSNLNSLS